MTIGKGKNVRKGTKGFVETPKKKPVAPKPKKIPSLNKTVVLPLKAHPVLPTKELRDKPTYVPTVNKNPRATKLGTTEHIISQAQSLTEDQAVKLWHMTRNPDISWGLAQGKAMSLFELAGGGGEARYAALQLKWDSVWPDFSKYYNDIAWDYSWNAMAWALVALELRGDLTQKEYNILTKPWRLYVGQIHPGDLEMTETI